MTHRHVFVLLLCATLFIVAGCEQTSVAEQERVQGLATLEAGTPSATPAPTNTPLPSATPIPTNTPGPTATASATPVPSATPLPPTPTPNAALANFSFCDQTVGDLNGGRFSARVTGITTTVEAAFERMTLVLDVPSDSVAPSAMARCVSAANDATQRGAPTANAAGYVLLIDLPDWLHDDRFNTSVATTTLPVSGTQVLKNVSYRFDKTAAAGASIVVPLDQPRAFRLELASNPTRLIFDVAKTETVNASSDMLSVAAGSAAPSSPLFYLQDDDVWKFDGGKPIDLTSSAAAETDLAVSHSTNLVAFCRAELGADADDALATSTLWTMTKNGGEITELADVGRSCAEPVFSPDGSMIAFTVNEGTSTPPRLSIYTVPAAGGQPVRVTPANDEWSRFGPQWLDGKRLVYDAAAQDGRNTLFLWDGQQERDIGADLVVGDRYQTLGRPFVAPNGSQIALEAQRASKPGADIVLLDGNGKETATIGDQYWNRPAAWGEDGTLFYVSSACASEAVFNYTLKAHPASGADRTIANGVTLGGFGSFSSQGNGLAYVTFARTPPGPSGPLTVDRTSASGLWFWDVSTGNRSKIAEATSAITDLQQ